MDVDYTGDTAPRLALPIGVTAGRYNPLLCVPRDLHLGKLKGTGSGRYEVGYTVLGGAFPCCTPACSVRWPRLQAFSGTAEGMAYKVGTCS